MSYIGIDLGTTFSAVAMIDPSGRAVIIPNAEGELTTPSVVLFESENDVVVGREAKRAATAEPENVAMDVKRYMGDEEFPKRVRGQHYSPVFLSALILKKLVQDAKSQAGEIKGAVVTVPAYFNEARRQATAAALVSAGIPLLDIINEPTAAALAYAYTNVPEAIKSSGQLKPAGALFHAKTIVVYDLGGGTFDVTVLRSEGNELRVLATAGDVQLGGRDWDERIVEHLAKCFLEEQGTDPREDSQSLHQLYDTAENLKKDLTRRSQSRFAVHHDGQVVNRSLSRLEFEKLTEDLLYRTEMRVSQAIREAGLGWAEIDEVLVVGGSTRMPAVSHMLEELSGRAVNTSLAPDAAVAHGAAIHAAICAAHGVPRPATSTDQANRNELLPGTTADHGWLATLGKWASLLRLIKTTNVTPHTLGVVVHDLSGKSKVLHMLPRNSRLPAEVSHRFGTRKTNQRRVTVHVIEGESTKPEHGYPVGTCLITSLPPSLPKGSPVEVKFRYDTSGRLQIEALHVASGRWAETSIERRGGVDQERVQLNHDALQNFQVS